MTSQNKTRIQIAKILRSHGIKGELKIMPSNAHVISLKKETEVYVYNRFDRFTVMHIESIRKIPQGGILKLQELTNRTDAEKYAQGYVTIERSLLNDLPENEWYIADLIGFKVVNEKGEVLGLLNNVLTMPAHEVYEIDCHGEKKLIPAVEEFIKKIDTKKKTVTIVGD
ncbi:16S rRNA processing protein RimM, partial [bacterium]|nr:16S rRNA processing protein RimM [bacterium]